MICLTVSYYSQHCEAVSSHIKAELPTTPPPPSLNFKHTPHQPHTFVFAIMVSITHLISVSTVVALTAAQSDNTTSTITEADISTTTVTITSCDENKCTEIPVETGVTIITETVEGMETIYTTYCPLPTTIKPSVKPTTTVSPPETITTGNGTVHPTVPPLTSTTTTFSESPGAGDKLAICAPVVAAALAAFFF